MIDLIADFQGHLVELDRAESTVVTYGGTLRQADAELPMGLIAASEHELKAWLHTPGWSRSTRHQRQVILTGFFRFACNPRRRPHIDFNPALYLPRFRVQRGRPRPVATKTLREILAAATGPLRRYCLLAAYEGARCVEIAALDRDDIGERDTLLHGKGRTDRVVPTHPLVWQMAQQLPPGPVAVGPRGARLNRHDVSIQGNRGLDDLGHPKVTMHQLRHWFGTEAFEACRDIRVAQELLGHASVSTTQIYVQASRSRMEQAVNALPGPTG